MSIVNSRMIGCMTKINNERLPIFAAILFTASGSIRVEYIANITAIAGIKSHV